MSRRRVTLAPSDLPRAASARVRVGGRVADVRGDSVTLADALTAVRARFRAAPADIEPGDLVVIEGRFARGTVADARVIERHPAAPTRGDGEHARLAWNGVGPRLALRAKALAAVRAWLDAEGFVEVETPVRVPAPGLDLHVDAIPARGGFLVTSPEHHMKRLLTGGMPRIYQLARASRADESGALHEPEFTLLEWYRAFSGQDAVMRDTEQIVARVARAVAGRAELRLGDRRIDARPPFERITVREAFRRHAGVRDATTLAEARFFELLVDRVEPGLALNEKPIFLCEYPIAQASLARPVPGDARVAERFELYAAGVELCNGFGELVDPVEQRRRFKRDRADRRRLKRPAYPIDDKLIAALTEGMPPSGGNALGFDRLLMLACGATRIADVQAFPASRI